MPMTNDESERAEIQKIVEAEKARSRRARERMGARLEEARAEAQRIAVRLAEADPEVRRVILFGSVASGRVRSERFDIDLVDLQSVSDGFRRMVEARGITLYDARGRDPAHRDKHSRALRPRGGGQEQRSRSVLCLWVFPRAVRPGVACSAATPRLRLYAATAGLTPDRPVAAGGRLRGFRFAR
jgi:hypothetical protein